jgi:hypothetical protein
MEIYRQIKMIPLILKKVNLIKYINKQDKMNNNKIGLLHKMNFTKAIQMIATLKY